MTIDVQGLSCRLELYVINHEDHDVLRCLNWFAYFCPNEGILRFKSEVVYLESEENLFGKSQVEQILISEITDGANSEDIEGETDWPVLYVHKVEPASELTNEQLKEFGKLSRAILTSFSNLYND